MEFLIYLGHTDGIWLGNDFTDRPFHRGVVRLGAGRASTELRRPVRVARLHAPGGMVLTEPRALCDPVPIWAEGPLWVLMGTEVDQQRRGLSQSWFMISGHYAEEYQRMHKRWPLPVLPQHLLDGKG